ncbi:MAG: nuclear transport factor 2 family protein [Sphingomonas fennica]
MDRAGYEDYLRRFNARDYDGVMDYYGEAPKLDFFGVALRSRAEVKDFYRFLHRFVDEEITLLAFAGSDELAAAEVMVKITGRAPLTRAMLDERGLHGMHPIEPGQVIEMEQFVHYRLAADGRIDGVRCTLA